MSDHLFSSKGLVKKTLLPLPSAIYESADFHDQSSSAKSFCGIPTSAVNQDHTFISNVDNSDNRLRNTNGSNNLFSSSSGFLNPLLPAPDSLLTNMHENNNKVTLLSLPDSDNNMHQPSNLAVNLPALCSTQLPPPYSVNTNVPPPIAMGSSILGAPPIETFDKSLPPPIAMNTNVPPPAALNTRFPPPTVMNSNIPPSVSVNTNIPPPNQFIAKLPPPAAINVTAPSLDFLDTSKPPPDGLPLINVSDTAKGTNINNMNTTLPPPTALHTGLPPPGMINTGLPPPSFKNNFAHTNMSVPPPDYQAVDNVSNAEYLKQLKEWYKQNEDYEHKMLGYFEKKAENLREWHKNGGDQTDDYRMQYAKLTSEYNDYIEYMNTFKTYYDQQVAEVKAQSEKIEIPHSSNAAVVAEQAPSNSQPTFTNAVISSAPAISSLQTTTNPTSSELVKVSAITSVMITSTPTVTGSFGNSASPQISSTKPVVSHSSIDMAAVTMGYPKAPPPPTDAAPVSTNQLSIPLNDNDPNSSNPSYYANYCKQMIDYFSQLLHTAGEPGQPAPLPSDKLSSSSQQGPPPPPPPPPKEDTDSDDSSDNSEDNDRPKLSRNQKKKLKRKKNQQHVPHKTKKERKLEKEKNTSQTKVEPAVRPSIVLPIPAIYNKAPPNFNPNMPPPGYQPPIVNLNPQSTMKMCLDQMNNSGRWDWGSWNTYMSGIAQSNPQWYDIFQQFSASMGLDWSKMSSKSSTNINYNSMQSTSSAHLVSNDSNKKTIFSEPKDESESATKSAPSKETQPESEDSDSDEPSDKSQPKWCKDCDQSFSNYHAYTLHLRGLKHIHNALDRVKNKNPDQFADEYQREMKACEEDLAKEGKHLEWVLCQYKSEKRKGLGISGSFYCKLCNVECTSEKVLQFHLNGIKHTKNIEQVLQTGKKENQHKKSGSQKVVVRIQKILDNCLEALIGLEYIVEYQREDPLAESRYYCELCDHRFDPASFIPHVSGVQHRKNYMKYNFYDLYEILDQDKSNKSVKAKRISIFARKIEEYEGRKKINLRREISNPELKAQKLKEAEEKKKEKELKEQQKLAEARQAVLKLREERREKRIIERQERMEAAKRLEEHIKEQEKLDIRYAAKEDMEEGEILSDEEEETPKTKSKKRKRTKRDSSDFDSDSDSDSGGSSRKSSLSLSDASNEVDIETEVRAERERRRKIENDDDEEVDKEFNDFEMAEFEDATTTERRPLAIQLKEDHDRDDFIRRLKEKKMLKLKEVDKESSAHFVFEADWVLERCKAEEVIRKAKLEEEREKKRQEAQMKTDSQNEKKQSDATSKKRGKQFILPSLSENFGPSKQDSNQASATPTNWQDFSLFMAQMVGADQKKHPTNLPPSFEHSKKIAEEFNRKIQLGENPFPADPNFSYQQMPPLLGMMGAQNLPFSEIMGKRKFENFSHDSTESKKFCLPGESNPMPSRPLLPTPTVAVNEKFQQPIKKTLLSTPIVSTTPMSFAKPKQNITYGLIPDSEETVQNIQALPFDQLKKAHSANLKSKPNTPLLPLPTGQSNFNLSDDKVSIQSEPFLPQYSTNESVTDKIQSVLNDLDLPDLQFADNNYFNKFTDAMDTNEPNQFTRDKTSNVVRKTPNTPLLPLPVPRPDESQDANKIQRNAPLLTSPEKIKPIGGLLPTPQSSGQFIPPPSSSSPPLPLEINSDGTKVEKPLPNDVIEKTTSLDESTFKRPLPLISSGSTTFSRVDKPLFKISSPADLMANSNFSNRPLLPLPSQLIHENIDDQQKFQSLLPSPEDVVNPSEEILNAEEEVDDDDHTSPSPISQPENQYFTQVARDEESPIDGQIVDTPLLYSVKKNSNKIISLPSKISIQKRPERPLLSSSDISAFNEENEQDVVSNEFEFDSISTDFTSRPTLDANQYELDNVVRYPGLDYPDRPAVRIPLTASINEEKQPSSKSLLPTPDMSMLRSESKSEFAPPRDYYSGRNKKYDWSGLDVDLTYSEEKNKLTDKIDRQRVEETHDDSDKIPRSQFSSHKDYGSSSSNSRKMKRDRYSTRRSQPYQSKKEKTPNQSDHFRDDTFDSGSQHFQERQRQEADLNLPVGGLENVNFDDFDKLKAILQGVDSSTTSFDESNRCDSIQERQSSKRPKKENPFVLRHHSTEKSTLPSDKAMSSRNQKHSQDEKPEKAQ